MSDSKHLYIRRASAGSGKTYTLAAHYVALLLHGESFRTILAVTFTNKATSEMKERILGYLYALARYPEEKETQGFLGRVRGIYLELGYDPGEIVSDSVVKERAEQIFTAILADYDAMHVQTIDAFLQTLLSGMVQMLNGAVGYSVELDTKRVISDAVDSLLTTGVRDNKELLGRISHYMQDRMDEEKSWDIRQGLNTIGQELYRESLQQHEERLVFDPEKLSRFARMPKDTSYAQLVTRYANDMILMGALRDQIQQSLEAANSRLLATTANTLGRALKTGDAAFVLEKAGIRYRHIMLDEFQDTSSLQWENFRALVEELLSVGGSTLIVGDIKQSIYRWRNGDWTIMDRLAATEPFCTYYNAKLPALQRNFRSEREVVRFNLDTFRYLSDKDREGEDMQRLYNEDYNGTNLSDYYRNGHEDGYVSVRMYPYRYKSKNNSVNTRPLARTNIIRAMFTAIHGLLESGVRAKEMMILVRLNKEAKEILTVLEQMRAEEAYPLLKTITLVSNDCFQLHYSQTVNVLVCAIRYVYTGDGVAREFVRNYNPAYEIESQQDALRSMALTDMVEAVLEGAVLNKKDDAVDDLAYVNTFRDGVRRFVQANGSDGRAFLHHWDEKMADSSIPATEGDGIRLMTIHSSKGLQAANVFIPFVDWAMEKDRTDDKLWCAVEELKTESGEPALMPIPQKKEMGDIPALSEDYRREHRMQRVDNLNLLYVALTRAAERLYLYADIASHSTAKGPKDRSQWDAGQLLADRLGLWTELDTMLVAYQTGGEEDYIEYTQGQEQWPRPEKQDKQSSSPTEPFSFAGAETTEAECYSRSANLEFRQSQESANYGWDIASHLDETPEENRRVFGTLCHDILATIGIYDTVDEARQAVSDTISRAYDQGRIPTEAWRDEALSLLLDTVSDLQMADWYTGKWRVLCEQALLLRDSHGEAEERRMDRVMWDDKAHHAIVLDYKFGHDDIRYDQQVRHYMRICEQMGATKVEGYLWIAAERCLQPVKL